MGIRLKFSVTPNIGIALANSCKTTTSAIKTARYAIVLAVKKRLLFIKMPPSSSSTTERYP